MSERDKPEPERQLGFKQPDEINLVEPDDLMASMYINQDGIKRPMTALDMVRPILEIDLDETVPFEVRRAFLFARNAMAYAYWYYPLLTIGTQQLLRVADYANAQACTANSVRGDLAFAERTKRLLRKKVIPASDSVLWDFIRDLRNRTTHPDWQQTWGFADAINITRTIADAIRRMKWPSSDGG